jgi:two-component system sensor histidine kinase MtrB
MDSRRNRGLTDAGLPSGGGDKLATVPVQNTGGKTAPHMQRASVVPRLAGASPTADPTALPGNGARVVPRPSGAVRRPDDLPAAGGERTVQERGRDGGGPEGLGQGEPEELGQGEAFRGR